MIKKMIKKTKGFTLTELIVVITILGILTAIAVPLVTSYIDDSKKQADASNAKIIEGVVMRNVSRGKLTIGDSTLTGTTVGTYVKEELKVIPTAQQTDFEFYVERATGSVEAAESAKNAGWDLIE